MSKGVRQKRSVQISVITNSLYHDETQFKVSESEGLFRCWYNCPGDGTARLHPAAEVDADWCSGRPPIVRADRGSPGPTCGDRMHIAVLGLGPSMHPAARDLWSFLRAGAKGAPPQRHGLGADGYLRREKAPGDRSQTLCSHNSQKLHLYKSAASLYCEVTLRKILFRTSVL